MRINMIMSVSMIRMSLILFYQTLANVTYAMSVMKPTEVTYHILSEDV